MFTRDQFDLFLGGLKNPPNKFQHSVLESLPFGSGNTTVSALAGSGKTTLIIQCAQLLGSMGDTSATFIAFNKKIATELNDRLPRPFTATTSHSLGMGMLKAVNKNTKLDFKKWDRLCMEIIEDKHFPEHETYSASRMLEKLSSKVMLNNIDPKDFEAVIRIADHYSIGSDDDPGRTERIARLVPLAIQKATEIWKTTGVINFDEMIYLPVVLDLQPRKFNWVFVDESQDLNVLQQELSFRSVTPTGRLIYVGDERQAIYGFAGADAASFKRIIEKTKSKVLPLNICYRCPTTHLELARTLVPEIEAAPNARTGIVEYADEDDLYTLVSKGCLVMCRLNAPLMSAYFQLIQRQIVARVMGKDIAKDLINTVKHVADFEGFRYDLMITYLEKYREQQIFKLQQKTRAESQIEILNDKVDCLIVCVENFKVITLNGFIETLESLFMDDDKDDWSNVVALCTVHKAKGLEADLTFILRPEKMPLMWPGQQPWELEQEMNIKYVALTRSKQRMVILGEAPTKEVPTRVKQDMGDFLIEEAPALPAPKPSPVGEKVEATVALKPGDYNPIENDEYVEPETIHAGPTPFEKSLTNFLSAGPATTPKPPAETPKPELRVEPAPLPEIKTVETKPLPAPEPAQLSLLPAAVPEVDMVTKMARAMNVDELKKMIDLLNAVVAEKETVN